jgi:predicted metalloendopeptidase
MLKENKVDDWKAHALVSVKQSFRSISTDIENANFDFYGKTEQSNNVKR